jgi:pimeloyl-ACP methyl ester carboxylesterase
MTSAPAATVIEVRGVRTAVKEKGSGPPLLMLHGSGGPGPWHPYQDALAEQFRVIVPSHPGYGESERPDWLDSMEDMVYHYLDLLQTLGLGKAHVLGTSLGGWIAAELAVGHSSVVDKLILVDPAGLKVPGMSLPDLFDISEEDHTRLLYHDQKLADEAIRNTPPPTSEVLLERIKGQTTFARLAWNPYLYNPKLGRRLRRIDCPTLIIWGREDAIIPYANAALWTEAMPQARLATIDECGHSPQREKPEEMLRLVLDFLTEGA